MNVDEGDGDGGEGSGDTRVAPVATPIFDALLTEFSLEWPEGVCGTARDPDAPNEWFEPATKADPATIADPLR